VDGLVRLMNSTDEVTGPINLGNPQETSVRALADEIIRRTASACKIEQKPLPTDDPVRRQPDIAKAKQTLSWAPTTALGDGLDRTITYFKSVL